MTDEYMRVTYRLAADTQESAHSMAEDICVEQTVEFPRELITDEAIRTGIFGQLESLEQHGDRAFRAEIRFPAKVIGRELPQLLNVLFGNISFKPGIRIEGLALSEGCHAPFRGPRFGRQGLRERLGIPSRPILSTAVKPMGLPVEALAELAYQLALGGMDIIKDDHGLANQAFSPFEARVRACAQAVARANRQTGDKAIYMPNITAPADQFHERARFAKSAGVGGLLICPGLIGMDAMRLLADDDNLDLPLLFHPALLGSYILNPEQGLSHHVLFGQLARLAGADGTIFPSYGGRFSFTREECRSLVKGTEVPMGGIAPIFPVPAGGMGLDNVPEMRRFYSDEVMFLIGGDLHRRGALVETCRHFRELVERPPWDGS